MKEMVDIGSRFIRLRDEAESLRGKIYCTQCFRRFFLVLCLHSFFLSEALRLAEERANDLEKKLKASEKAHKKAEKEAADVKDLHQRLRAAEDALSDKEAQLVQRENDIIARFEMQSSRFLSNTIPPFVLLLAFSC
jgi:hypothetical protein